MTAYHFGAFLLDPAQRQLLRDGAPVEISNRYLDALALMVSEAGALISKDRFMDDVWRGVPVTDEALTQCIRTLRRQLGDDAAKPRFIETVPKHGYRFIAAVERVESGVALVHRPVQAAPPAWMPVLLLGGAALIGGGMAGMIGSLFYGFAGVTQPNAPGMGAISVLLVLMSLCIIVGAAGGAAVGLGIATAGLFGKGVWWRSAIGGALGGLAVGAVAKLLGMDAFTLLLGQSPANVTGAAEGAVLGAATGIGVWLSGGAAESAPVWRRVLPAAGLGAGAGLIIALAGGRLMGGSLDLLAQRFPESRLQLDQVSALFGEGRFGPVSHGVTAVMEAMLFAACVAAAMAIAQRQMAHRE